MLRYLPGISTRGPLGLQRLQCIRTGERPDATIDDRYKHAVAVLTAVRSCETGRAVTYDHTRRAMLPA